MILLCFCYSWTFEDGSPGYDAGYHSHRSWCILCIGTTEFKSNESFSRFGRDRGPHCQLDRILEGTILVGSPSTACVCNLKLIA